jgi:hypothetical protein
VQFVTSLRSLMARCDYEEQVQAELLRIHLQAACASDTIREKLLPKLNTFTLQ